MTEDGNHTAEAVRDYQLRRKADKTTVTALIEVKVTPQRGDGFDKIAQRIYRNDEVRAVFLMSGGYDLCVMVEGKDIREVSMFVSDKAGEDQ